jgi:hypothetical protein
VTLDQIIILLVPLAGVVVIAFSYYTVRGSTINQRPRSGGRGDAQGGSQGRSRITGAGEEPPRDLDRGS